MICRSRVARDPVTPQRHLPRHRYELFFIPPQRRYNLIIILTEPRLPIALKQESLPIPVHKSRLGRDCLCLPMKDTSHDWGGIAMSTNWKDTSYESILVMRPADSLSERIYQGISRRDLHWKSTSYDPILAYENGTFQAGVAPGLTEVFIDLTFRHGPPRPPRLDCTLRLSLHLQVLVS